MANMGVIMDNHILSEHFAELLAGGFDACEHVENGQKYIEVRKLPINSPPWNKNEANILIVIPNNYNLGGLDGFYVENGVLLANNQPHPRTRVQGAYTILGRKWWIVSWHYYPNKPWSLKDTLVTHVQHCRQFFKQGERNS